MTDIEKITLTHPYIRVLKVLLVTVAVSLFLADMALHLKSEHVVSTYTKQQNQATWFLFQLTKEFSELVAHSGHLNENSAYMDEVLLKYELTWSRFDLLINNEESDSFKQIADVNVFFPQLFEQFKLLEPLLEPMALGKEQSVQEFVQRVNALYITMIDYVNHNFSVTSPLYEEHKEKAKTLSNADIYLIIGVVFCVVLLFYIYYKESEYNRKLALTDPLTQLFNRLALFNLLSRYKHEKQVYTLCLLDLNGFKHINDKYGHQTGDDVLTEVANRLQKLKRYECLVFRIGGDEFAIVLKSTSLYFGNIDGFCHKVFNEFNLPFKSEDSQIVLSVSIGYSNFPTDSQDVDDLMHIADKRMYKMKHNAKLGKNSV